MSFVRLFGATCKHNLMCLILKLSFSKIILTNFSHTLEPKSDFHLIALVFITLPLLNNSKQDDNVQEKSA